MKKHLDNFYVKSGLFNHYKIHNLNRSLIAIGGAGSGKTYSIINPLLGYCIPRKGVLTFDPKGELTPLINTIAKKHNKPIINFSLDNNYDIINPLTLCENKSDIIEFSSYFLSGIVGIPQQDNAKYFFNAAKSVLTGVIVYFRNKKPKLCTIPHIIALFLSAKPEQITSLLNSDEEAKRASQVLVSINEDKKLLGSVLSTFTAFFASLDTPLLFRNLVSHERLDLPNNPQNPNVINLIFNLSKRDLYTPIYSSIIGMIIKKMNIPNQAKSAVIIDEFTVLSIPNYSNIPETSRSNGISNCIAIQDFSQLISRYGKEEASSIISNMGSQFLFRTTNPETLEHFQKMLGTREVENISNNNSTDLSFKYSQNKGIRDKNILNNEQVIKYKPGQCFAVIADGNKHFIENKRITGNHYLKTYSNKSPIKETSTDERRVYNQVYADIKSLLKRPQITTPEKFNI